METKHTAKNLKGVNLNKIIEEFRFVQINIDFHQALFNPNYKKLLC